jgi:spore coat polysaccharide biosynthesis protein SpsF
MKSLQAEGAAAGGTAIVVQARIGSSRLPGKVLLPIAGRPMLSYQLERLREARRPTQLLVATSTEPADEAIAALCEREGVACVRGPEQDVLRRFAMAARTARAGAIARITADCPLLDPELIDEAIAAMEDPAEPPDFVSNMLEPRWPLGMAVEVASTAALLEADRDATDPEEREHVMPFIWRRPERYRLASLTRSPDLSHHRWTVDTPEDFELVSRIIAGLYPRLPHFRITDVLALLERNPSWSRINRHVPQKTIAARGAR